MAGYMGADTEAMRDVASIFSASGQRLEELRATLQSTVQSVDWVGSDAESFKGDFSSRVSGLFDQATGRLETHRTDLDRQADEQDEVSGVGGGGGDGGGLQAAIADLLKNPILGAYDAASGLVGAGGALWKLGKYAMNMRAIGGALDDVARAAATSKLISDAAGFLGKLGPAGKFLGAAGGVLSIYDGISDMIDPPHDGWRGVGDRIAGGLGVVGGAGGIALALGAGAALGPVGIGVVLAAGAGAALWTAGNAIVDNWPAIKDFAGDVGGHISDFASDAGDAIGEGAKAVGDAVGDAAGAVGDFVGGIF